MRERIGRGNPRRRDESGFTLIELLVTMAIIFLIASIAIPIYTSALTKSRTSALVANGRGLYSAFMQFEFDNDVFPATSTPPSRTFNLSTLFPLSTSGYISHPTSLTTQLQGGMVTAYDSPNVGGPDSQFWAVLTSATDPSIVILIANTDQYPGNIGTWYDGVYLIQGTSIVPVA